MTSRPRIWPRAVNELLPNTLFRLASQYPDLTYSEYPRTNKAADGYRKITYKDVANAVHAVAWWIDQNVGKPAKDRGVETMVYMGPNDLRYGILVLSSVMVGYKVFNPSIDWRFDNSSLVADALPSPALRCRSHHYFDHTCKRLDHAHTIRIISRSL